MLFTLLSKYQSTCWLKNWLKYWFILSHYDSFITEIVDKCVDASVDVNVDVSPFTSTTPSIDMGINPGSHHRAPPSIDPVLPCFLVLVSDQATPRIFSFIHVIFQLNIQVLFLFSNQDVASQH